VTFSEHVSSVARSSRSALFNIRKIGPFLTQQANQLLVLTMVVTTNRPPSSCNKTASDGSEHDGASGFRSAVKGTRHPSGHWASLATCSCSQQNEITNSSPQSDFWVFSQLPQCSLIWTSVKEHRLALAPPRAHYSRLFPSMVPHWCSDLSSAKPAGAPLFTSKKLLKTLLYLYIIYIIFAEQCSDALSRLHSLSPSVCLLFLV